MLRVRAALMNGAREGQPTSRRARGRYGPSQYKVRALPDVMADTSSTDGRPVLVVGATGTWGADPPRAAGSWQDGAGPRPARE